MSCRPHRLLPEPFYRIVDDLDEIDLRSLRLISREANQRGRRRPLKRHLRLRVRYGPSKGLDTLPFELLGMVVDCLEDRDVISLRRVSRRMASATFKSSWLILARCLRTLRTDLSSSSIANLHAIVSTPDLNCIPQTLQIVPPFGPLSHIDRSVLFDMIESPTSIPTINILKQYLKHSLPNCKSFEICLNRNNNDHLSTDDIVHILFHLFVEADRRPEQLTLYSQSPHRHPHPPETSPQDLLRPHHRIAAHPDLSRAWTNLHTLTISEPYFEYLRSSLDFILPRVLEHAPRLERLIIIGNSQSGDSVNFFEAMNKAMPVCGLKHIEIRNFHFPNTDFHDWLKENGHSLMSLTFSECSTEPNQSWDDMMEICLARDFDYVYAGPDIRGELEWLKMRLREWDPASLAPLELD
ncbi:hypothetical protein BO78DRAFT_472863 [Aspergillus sclerotiicarbonarius CBS 121057]|uniref:F-box domain-containing protein n=1 Tax=Aspergillus sclerotiicarbonarius (strain CBS 121057 / IBT 28362) TaxID=1448318 RepID=A0A319F8U5_ASPSB|nr:hypothetical protein BO78DRAFT_472863 [Aspergillus sclerotiicarbonarius CBS 121057]